MRNVRKLGAVAIVGALGALGLVAIGAGPAAGAPTGYTMLETGDDTCQLGTVDLTSGEITLLPGVSDCASDITLSPEGVVYGIDERVIGGGNFAVLLRYDAQGNETVVGRITTFEAIVNEGEPFGGGLAFDNQGQLHAFFVGDDPGCDATIAYCLYQVDPSNPEAATFTGPMTEDQFFSLLAGSCAGGLSTIQNGEVGAGAAVFEPDDEAADPSTTSTTVAPDDGTTTTSQPTVDDELDEPSGAPGQLASVSKATGAVTPVGPNNFFVAGLAYGADGVLYAMAYGGGSAFSVATVDQTTGAVTIGSFISLETTTAIGLAMPMGCPQLSFAG